jgi:hyperosmotically inducible protein
MCAGEQILRQVPLIIGTLQPPRKAQIMKTTVIATCFLIGALFAPVAVHAADGTADHAQPMTFVKDSVITTKIKAKLAEEKLSSLVHVQVDTDAKGAVVLGGTVKTQAEADKAVAIAHATEGVTSVKSSIQVKMDD